MEHQEQLAEGPMIANKSRLQELQEALQSTRDKIEEERMYKRTYAHMLERMNKDHIASKIKTAELEKSIVTKKAVIDAEEEK